MLINVEFLHKNRENVQPLDYFQSPQNSERGLYAANIGTSLKF